MDTIQRLGPSYMRTTIDQIRLNHAHLKLRYLMRPRSRALIRALSEGPLSVKEIVVVMYRQGDHLITQCEVSQFISGLLKYDLIMRVHPEGAPGQLHYYALRHNNIRKIQRALDRFHGRLPD